MQTQRMLSLVNPARVEQLLDSYVSNSRTISADARKRLEWGGLPAELRHVAAQAIANGCVCSVWSDGESTWVFSGALALDRAREIGRPVLEVHRLDHAPHARDAIFAARLPDGSWSECAA